MRSLSLLATLTAPLLFAAPGIASGQEPPQPPPPAQTVAPAPTLTSIAGNWRFNPVASDNEQAKVRQGAARGAAIGGRGGRLGAGGRGGIGGAGRMPGNTGDVNQARARVTVNVSAARNTVALKRVYDPQSR